MAKSLVVCYAGGRGGGKTLSMSVEACRHLVKGVPVWSNYPIKFNYTDEHGETRALKSTLIDFDDLATLQKDDVIKDGIVCLDEWNLFCNSRRSGAMANLLFSALTQLIRHRHLSFYLTTQDIGTLDKNIRWQVDVTIECMDLSFKYKNLPEGAVISQLVTDWTGVFCGRPLTRHYSPEDMTRNTRTRMLKHARVFWPCYSSFEEFDVIDIMSARYSLKRENKLVGRLSDTGGYQAVRLGEYREFLEYSQPDSDRISVPDLQAGLKHFGLEGDLRGLGKLLKAQGFEYHQSRKGNFYKINSPSGVEGT